MSAAGSTRIIFMGTPDLAATVLQQLLSDRLNSVVAVVSQPDRPKGRDLKLQATPVKALALRHGISVLQPERARNEEFIIRLRSFTPDLIVVAAFGQILPSTILDLPRYGCLNVHTSLLPKYRGAAPIQWAILNGDPETGVTIMKMDPGMDTGAIVSKAATSIRVEDTSQSLHDRLADIGADLLVKTIPDYVSGRIQPTPQPSEGVSYAPKIKKADGLLDWSRPAKELWNKVRGLIPWPGAFTHFESGGAQHVLKVWSAELVDATGKPGEVLLADKHGLVVACGNGALKLRNVQREGGKRLAPDAFLAGTPLPPGTYLA